jgi:GT2 family glycosyltransferase
VIIPHHQGKDLIFGCLRSLGAQTYPDFETVVISNGCRDWSVESVEREFPQVRIISLPRNEGFAYAINLGARESTSEILAFLNNDAEVAEDWIDKGIKAFDEHPSVGILASRIMDFDRRDIVQNAGISIRRSGRPAGRGRGQTFDVHWAKEEEVFGASGGAMMVRRSVWEKVGPFREDFVSYLEDVDWAFRARLMGEKCMYVPDMVVYHREASTKDAGGNQGVDSPERVRLIARNKIWVLWLNTPCSLIVLHLPWILGGWFLSLAHHAFRSGQLGPFLMGTFEGKWGIFSRWKERSRIQNGRIIGASEIGKWFDK